MNNNRNIGELPEAHLLHCALLALAGGILVAGCHNDPSEKEFYKAAREMNQTNQLVSEWGRVTSSEIYLAPNTKQFSFTFKTENDNYYVDQARKKLEGAAASSLASSQAGAVQVNVGATPADGAEKLATGGLSSDQLQPAAITLPAPLLPLRFGLLQGFNDKIFADILRLLSNPAAAPNQTIYVGMLQVSCEPGTRTREGYVAELGMSLAYARKKQSQEPKPGDQQITLSQENINSLLKILNTNCGRGFDELNDKTEIQSVLETAKSYSSSNSSGDFEVSTDSGGPQPGVLAVLPLVDNQVLDLQNMRNEYAAFSLNLGALFSAAGMPVQAKAAYDYAEKLQKQQRTLSTLPTVTTFSNGHQFGIRFYPSLQALADPSSIRSGRSGNLLIPTTFPVVVFVLVDHVERDGNGTRKWTHYAFNTTPRWFPLNENSRQFTTLDALRAASDYDEASAKFAAGEKNALTPPSKEEAKFHNRLRDSASTFKSATRTFLNSLDTANTNAVIIKEKLPGAEQDKAESSENLIKVNNDHDSKQQALRAARENLSQRKQAAANAKSDLEAAQSEKSNDVARLTAENEQAKANLEKSRETLQKAEEESVGAAYSLARATEKSTYDTARVEALHQLFVNLKTSVNASFSTYASAWEALSSTLEDLKGIPATSDSVKSAQSIIIIAKDYLDQAKNQASTIKDKLTRLDKVETYQTELGDYLQDLHNENFPVKKLVACMTMLQQTLPSPHAPGLETFYQRTYLKRVLNTAPAEVLGFTRFAAFPQEPPAATPKPSEPVITGFTPPTISLGETAPFFFITLKDGNLGNSVNLVLEINEQIWDSNNGSIKCDIVSNNLIKVTITNNPFNLAPNTATAAAVKLSLPGIKEVPLAKDVKSLVLFNPGPETEGIAVGRDAHGNVTRLTLPPSETTQQIMGNPDVIKAIAAPPPPPPKAASPAGTN